MGELRIVKLRFRSAIHLGDNVSGIGLENSLLIAHSDTLFSCLINAYAELHSGNPGAVDELLTAFWDGEPPFRISSAFPYRLLWNGLTYYLPKPLIDYPSFYDSTLGPELKEKYGKSVRNTQLVPIDIFLNWLQGEEVDEHLEELKNQNIGSFCTREMRPQHARDRLTNASAIYHTGLVHFHNGAGLYFLIELNNKTLLNWNMFETILRQAGRNGLGGRRSHGNGTFDVTDGTISEPTDNWEELFALREQEGFNGFINLSVYLPETFKGLEPVSYQLIPRQGWCYSSVTPTQMKRKKVTMFGEGSVFRNSPKGVLADVTPDSGFTAHKLYRYGIPISLPIKILEEENDVS